MPADIDTALRLLVDHGLRLIIRAYCASVRGEFAVSTHIFGGPPTQQRRLTPPPFPDVVLSNDAAIVRALAPPDAAVVVFGSDSLVAASRPEIGLSAGNLLSRLQNTALRVAIAVPGLAARTALAERFWAVCDTSAPGLGGVLRKKIRVIAAADGLAWGPRQAMELLGSGEADIILGPNSVLRSLSAVGNVVTPSATLDVNVACCLAIVTESPARQAAAQRFVHRLLEQSGQAILARHGFGPAPPTALLEGALANAVM